MSDKKVTLQDVEQAFEKALLLEDKNIIRLICAVMTSNITLDEPVWLMIVAPSSGGKTSILLSLDGLKLDNTRPATVFISDITENTFASGFKKKGEDASLLNKLGWGSVLVFKDFTTMLTKRQEARDAVVGQLREIFDRKYDKHTGTGVSIEWRGKAGAIGGVTHIVYEYLPRMSAMGDRFVLYEMKQPPRKDVLRFLINLRRKRDSQEKALQEAKELLHQFLIRAREGVKEAEIEISPEQEEDIITVGDFSAKVSSGIIQDMYDGTIQFVPPHAMPTRLVGQMLAIATMLVHLKKIDGASDTKLDDNDMDLLYQLAFDTIPIKRRIALKYLAEFEGGITTKGLATEIGYETEVVKSWLSQLAALGIATRHVNGGTQGDRWMLSSEYRNIMVKFNKIKSSNKELIAQKSADDENIDEALDSIEKPKTPSEILQENPDASLEEMFGPQDQDV